ncbi:MAG: MATE family efflux transporter [Kangiellaceae bacterium]|nr:MATE family efflux transporter [Kangiellaceae bacterium]
MIASLKKELKELAPIGIPAVLSQLAQMAMGFIDTVMAGNYSTDALAAIAIGTSLLHPVLVFFLGLFLAFNPIIAHFRGADEIQKIRTHFHAGILLAVIFSPFAILALFNSQFVLHALDIDPAVSELAFGYLKATLWGMPALLLFFALRFCNEGMFSTMAVMTITGLSIPFNVLLNYWFLYGGYGIEEMGAVGVGYATGLIWFLMLIGMTVYTLVTQKYKELNLFKGFELPSSKEFKDVLALGFPVAITLGFEITMFAAVSLMIARYPVEVMGAHQIALNIASLTFMIPLGLSQAITARVSYFDGRKDKESMQLAGYTGIGSCVVIMSFSAIMMISIPTFLVGIYTTDESLAGIAVGLLFFAALFQFSDGLQVSSAGALRGLKDTKIPMIITAISYWLVGFPIGYYLAEFQNMQVQGYWVGMICGLSTAAVLLLRRWMVFSKL